VDVLNRARLLRGFAWGRLVASGVLLALGVLLPRSAPPRISVVAFAAALSLTVVSSVAVLARRRLGSRPTAVTSALLGVDVAAVTLVVLVTGGPESIFPFLYVLVVIASCVLLSRQGSMIVAGACCMLYTAIVVGQTILDATEPVTETTGLAVLTMFINAGTFLVVAIVAGSLAEEYRVAQSALDHHRKDLGDLLAFKDLLVESVGTGLVAVDLSGRITTFNRAAADITGIPASQAMGRPWPAVFGEACALPDPPPAGPPDPPVERAERPLRRADGREIPVSLTVSPLRSGDGRAIGLIVTCESLAPIREMEARVRQADRLAAVGRMAANIAHEIRNPLASMTGAVEFLAKDTDAATRERLAQIVLHESERLDRIIRDLLDYARPAPLNPQAMNLTDTLDDVLTLLEHRPLPETVKVVRSYGGELPVDADPQQLRQVFWNLCLNAVEAMPDGGQLHVGARRLPTQIEVWVSDTGAGIHDSDLPHVFEPFFSTKSEGSGIGLALVHRIIQEHGGEIDVRSVFGVGTTVSITLPVAHA